METKLDVRNIDLRNAQEMVEDNVKQMQKSGRKVALAYAGLFGMAYDGAISILKRGGKFVDEAESRGVKMEETAQRQMKDAQRGMKKQVKKAEKEMEKVQKRLVKQLRRSEATAENEVDTQVERVLERLGIPSRERIVKLSAEIEALSRKIDQQVAQAQTAEMEAPLAGYDAMTAREIVALLDGMYPAQLAEVKAYETARENRVTVIREVERRLEISEETSKAVAA